MWMLAADDSGAFETSTATGAIALVVAVVATAVMLWLRTSTRPSRPRPGTPTIDLRPETPAVVDLLTGGFEVEDDAMPATVVDLAARRWFTIEDVGGDRIVLRLRQRAGDDELTRYESRVLAHIRAHAVDGVVPAPVLTLGPQGVSERWFTGFRREVTAHARELGLCRRRWDLRHVVMAWGAVLVAFAPVVVVANTVGRTDDPTGWGSPGNLLLGVSVALGVVLMVYAGRISGSDAQVDTPDGLRAASHWMGVRTFYRDSGRFEDKPAASVTIWERTLAYATAMGLAPLVQRQIPFETEHDRHAWSLATGHWRRVKVSYRAVRPGWGASPWSVSFTALFQTAFFGVVAYAAFHVASTEIDVDQVTFTDDQRRYIGLGGLVVAVVATMACVYSFGKLLLGLSDLFARRTVEGELVRQRRFGSTSSDRNSEIRHYLAIDTGEGDRIRAYRVGAGIYARVSQGARVRATVTPRLGYVSAIESLTPPRVATASSATDTDDLQRGLAEARDQLDQLAVGSATTSTPLVARLLDNLTGDGRPDPDPPDASGADEPVGRPLRPPPANRSGG